MLLCQTGLRMPPPRLRCSSWRRRRPAPPRLCPTLGLAPGPAGGAAAPAAAAQAAGVLDPPAGATPPHAEPCALSSAAQPAAQAPASTGAAAAAAPAAGPSLRSRCGGRGRLRLAFMRKGFQVSGAPGAAPFLSMQALVRCVVSRPTAPPAAGGCQRRRRRVQPLQAGNTLCGRGFAMRRGLHWWHPVCGRDRRSLCGEGQQELGLTGSH